MKNSIKSKLILVSALLLIIPMLVLGFFTYTKSQSSLDELGAIKLTNSVEMTIELIDALQSEVEKGTLTLEDAQERVKLSILGEMNDEGRRPINENIDLGEYGYLFIIGQDGTLIGHPNLEGTSIWNEVDSNGDYFAQDLVSQGNLGGGFTYYDWPLPHNENIIERKVTYSKVDPHWDWVVSSGAYMSDFNAPANDIRTTIIIVTSVTLLLGVAVIWLFATRITKPIQQVTERMLQLKQGDLRNTPLHIKTNDEIGKMATAMNDMQKGLQDMLTSITAASENLSGRSEELTQSANEVKSGSEQVAVTMQELASGAETQVNSASDLATLMESFVTKVQNSSEQGKNILTFTEETLQLTDKGTDLMKSSTQQMATIDQLVKDSVQKVQGLDKQSQEISKLVSVIKDIAEQTNLL
ncbi:methyl-accepting chemotaxis protein, partial [Halalkalibacter wakoensis]|uniref:methyl-accepting chemotaxis protein n=1 Tax=Halalkalibacter wakoensis TaxID=127891 RepID=UPI00054ED196